MPGTITYQHEQKADQIKLIVTDLDSTLLRRDKTISAYTKSVFARCREKGILTAFATARSENSCGRITGILDPDAIISNGGAGVRIGDKQIYRAAMSVETTNRLLLVFLETPGVGYITADTDRGYFVNYPLDENDPGWNPGWIEYLPAFEADFSRGLDCDAFKITVELPDDNTAFRIVSAFPSVNVIPFSGEKWYRFADINAGKWNGVKALAAHTGIALTNIAAFGDDFSDIEMVKHSGAGVAVSNAIDEVKAAAGYVCADCDDDGPAKWIAENIL